MTLEDLTAAGFELAPAFDVDGVTVYAWTRGGDHGYLRADTPEALASLLKPPAPPLPRARRETTVGDLAAAISGAATFADAQKAVDALAPSDLSAKGVTP